MLKILSNLFCLQIGFYEDNVMRHVSESTISFAYPSFVSFRI